jgi:hypothetical protein
MAKGAPLMTPPNRQRPRVEWLTMIRTVCRWIADHYPRLVPVRITIEFDGAPPVTFPLGGMAADDGEPVGLPVTPAAATHGDDFRSVSWFGEQYSFSAQQAKAVEALWLAWEDGLAASDKAVLRACGSAAGRLGDVFKDHPAWGAMVVKVRGRHGQHRLNPPPGYAGGADGGDDPDD